MGKWRKKEKQNGGGGGGLTGREREREEEMKDTEKWGEPVESNTVKRRLSTANMSPPPLHSTPSKMSWVLLSVLKLYGSAESHKKSTFIFIYNFLSFQSINKSQNFSKVKIYEKNYKKIEFSSDTLLLITLQLCVHKLNSDKNFNGIV